MARIGVGIIGLSATSSWAVQAHLPYLQTSTKYEIIGVCNSSIESSEAAIKAHGLSQTAKAYGSVADLSANPEIGLVVCTVRVDRHYECLKPVIAAGKDCFVEWPLASNLEQATELLRLAEAKGIKTMVGLQGQAGPLVKRVKQLIVEEQTIGRVLSCNISLATGLSTDVTVEGYEYLNDVETGGNMLVIPFGHMYDSMSYTLGELQTVSATLSTQQADVAVRCKQGKTVGTIKRTTADHVSISGLLEDGGHMSAVVHGRGPIKGEPALVWQIEGVKGVLEVRSDSAFAVSMSGEMQIRLHDNASGDVKDIEFTEDHPGPPGNIGRLYEAFADGRSYPDWKWAVKRHAWANALYESNASGKCASYM
ncbi:NAD(P)-binding protein [Hortaea werneckii]|nr:NAD(P)-binding protein [Hortaea werneckii]